MLASAAAGRRVTVLHPRCGHTLRFYITPHCPQCPPVVSLKLHLVAVTAARPPGEGNGPLCKVVFAPFCLCAAFWVSGQALRASHCSVACGQALASQPPPTPAPRRFAALACAAKSHHVVGILPQGGELGVPFQGK